MTKVYKFIPENVTILIEPDDEGNVLYRASRHCRRCDEFLFAYSPRGREEALRLLNSPLHTRHLCNHERR